MLAEEFKGSIPKQKSAIKLNSEVSAVTVVVPVGGSSL